MFVLLLVVMPCVVFVILWLAVLGARMSGMIFTSILFFCGAGCFVIQNGGNELPSVSTHLTFIFIFIVHCCYIQHRALVGQVRCLAACVF